MSSSIFNSVRLVRVLSSLTLNVTRDVASTSSLGNLFHCFIITTKKKKNHHPVKIQWNRKLHKILLVYSTNKKYDAQLRIRKENAKHQHSHWSYELFFWIFWWETHSLSQLGPQRVIQYGRLIYNKTCSKKRCGQW